MSFDGSGKKHFFLIGPMGAGKTTLGKHLAKALNICFFDVDNEVVKTAGADIQWIFDVEGESGFRTHESKLLEKISQNQSPALIATGGGVILSEKNCEIMKKTGTVIYLYVSESCLFERLKRDKKRPLLQTGDRKDTISKIFKIRDPLYKQLADITYMSNGLLIKRSVSDLIKKIEEFAQLKNIVPHV